MNVIIAATTMELPHTVLPNTSDNDTTTHSTSKARRISDLSTVAIISIALWSYMKLAIQ